MNRTSDIELIARETGLFSPNVTATVARKNLLGKNDPGIKASKRCSCLISCKWLFCMSLIFLPTDGATQPLASGDCTRIADTQTQVECREATRSINELARLEQTLPDMATSELMTWLTRSDADSLKFLWQLCTYDGLSSISPEEEFPVAADDFRCLSELAEFETRRFRASTDDLDWHTVEGEYGTWEGKIGRVNIGAVRSGTVEFDVGVNRGSKTGGADGTIVLSRSGRQGVSMEYPEDSELPCKIEFEFSKLTVEIRETGCDAWSGSGISIDGTFSRLAPPESIRGFLFAYEWDQPTSGEIEQGYKILKSVVAKDGETASIEDIVRLALYLLEHDKSKKAIKVVQPLVVLHRQEIFDSLRRCSQHNQLLCDGAYREFLQEEHDGKE